MIGECDDRRPRRAAKTRSTHDFPRSQAREDRGLVDQNSRVGITVKANVGGAFTAGSLYRALITRLWLDAAVASTALGPGQFELVISSHIDVQRGSPHGHTVGAVEGHSGPPAGPLSPLAATNVIPACPLGVVNVKLYKVSFRNSVNPQLIEIATTPGVFRAVLTADTSAGSDCELASTTRMFAPGAMACAHSTSSDSSSAQPSSLACPAWSTTVSDGFGRPKVASNVFKSEVIVGSW